MSERYTQFLLDDFFPLYVKETDKYNFYESQRDSKDVFYNSIIQKKEFDQLRQAGEHYRELEKKFIEQKKIFDILETTDR